MAVTAVDSACCVHQLPQRIKQYSAEHVLTPPPGAAVQKKFSVLQGPLRPPGVGKQALIDASGTGISYAICHINVPWRHISCGITYLFVTDMDSPQHEVHDCINAGVTLSAHACKTPTPKSLAEWVDICVWSCLQRVPPRHHLLKE